MKLALRPTVPARERYYANPRPARRGNAPLRQTGSTVGPVFCGAAYAASGAAGARAGVQASLATIVRVGMEPDPIQATNAKRCQRRFMRTRRALPLQCGDRALKLGLGGEGR